MFTFISALLIFLININYLQVIRLEVDVIYHPLQEGVVQVKKINSFYYA